MPEMILFFIYQYKVTLDLPFFNGHKFHGQSVLTISINYQECRADGFDVNNSNDSNTLEQILHHIANIDKKMK